MESTKQTSLNEPKIEIGIRTSQPGVSRGGHEPSIHGSKQREIFECLDRSRFAKTREWPAGVQVTMMREYRHIESKLVGCLVVASQNKNELEIWFNQHSRWGGTIQDFQAQFEPVTLTGFKSCAQWPVGCFDHNTTPNYSEDTHGDHAGAEAVTSLLLQNGAGGDRVYFPVKTWVEPVYEAVKPEVGK